MLDLGLSLLVTGVVAIGAVIRLIMLKPHPSQMDRWRVVVLLLIGMGLVLIALLLAFLLILRLIS